MADGGRDYRMSETLYRFHCSEADVRGVMGPIGSGKSVACCIELLKQGHEQWAAEDGWRRTRFAVVRNTYPELKSTTIRTFLDWAPPAGVMRYDAPITWRLVDESKKIDIEILFLALDKPQDVKKLLSLELTGGWINEARELPYSVVEAFMSRLGRYPSKANGGMKWAGLIMDTNPPDDDHWWYRLAEIERPENHEFFRQPAAIIRLQNGTYAMNPDAENVINHALGEQYYLRQVPGKRPEWIKVYLSGDYGTVLEGKPVFPSYRDSIHCSPTPLAIMRGVPLYVGMDFGRTPAAIFGQFSPKGQLRGLREMCVETNSDGMSVRQFAREVVVPKLRGEFSGMRVIGRGDPAGIAKGSDTDLDCFQILASEGLFIEPTNTNDLGPRIDSIDKYLMRMTYGEPGLIIDPSMSMIRKGFNGGYAYKRVQVSVSGGDSKYRDEPDKNKYSHPMDAFEYMAMGVDESAGSSRAVARPIERTSTGAWT